MRKQPIFAAVNLYIESGEGIDRGQVSSRGTLEVYRPMANVKLFLSVALLAGLSGLPLTAQSTSQPTPGDQQSQSATPDNQKPTNDQPDPGAGQGTGNAQPVPHSASAPELANSQLRPVRAELVGKLDSKSAKTGDQVVLKTTEETTIANGVVIPKGSKIKGQVVEVRPHDGANRNAQLTLQFTQAELKGGQTLPILSVLQSVAPAESASTVTGATPMPSGNSDIGGAQSSGAAPGARGGGAANSGTTGTGGVSSGQTAQSGGSMGAPQAGVAGGANGAPAPGTVVAQQGNAQVKTTAVPGILIESSADGRPFANASGALLGAGQNVHLDGGTRVELAIVSVNQPGRQ